MPALSDVVSVSITTNTSNPTLPGFGTPLILSNTTNTSSWPDTVRTYTSLSGGVDVDFAVTTPEYKAAAKIFAQNPTVQSVMIAKGTNRPTQRWALTFTAVNSYTYRIVVNGTAVTFTSDATATLAEIHAGFIAAINLLGLGVTVTDQTSFLRIVANTPGNWFSVGSTDINVSIAQDHTDPGIATDLAAINLINSNWYALVTLFNSPAMVAAAAAWVQSNGKLYIVQIQESATPNTAAPGTDIAATLKTGNYDNTSAWFSNDNSDFLDAALLGARLPYTPGDETWKFVPLQGVNVGSYTATQRTNMLAKNCNFYEPTQGVPMTTEGLTASGKYIDLVRYLNYLQSRVGTRVFGRLAAFPKIPYTDDGIQMVGSEVRAQLQEDEKRGAIVPGWAVSVPKVANVSTSDKTNRILKNVTFSATYSGAIHKVLISGSVSV